MTTPSILMPLFLIVTVLLALYSEWQAGRTFDAQCGECL